ncbi:Hypothetical_protein [Hexamita inflata]|uniref:Hypothetical_protein n=1 Tax=Hexamita inflata TaxID=28002 RepID=A0AA86RMC9_9EUKA|nr:Hypothetical protein HINF_LOCUS64871 [Hexamita inflata]
MITIRGNHVVDDTPQYEHKFLDRINKSTNFSKNFGINDTEEILCLSQDIANRLYTAESREMRNYVKNALSKNFIKSQVKNSRLSVKDTLDERNIYRLTKELESTVVMNEGELRHFTTRKQYARIPQPKFTDVTPNQITELQQLQKIKFTKDKVLKNQITENINLKNLKVLNGTLKKEPVVMKRPQSSVAKRVFSEPLKTNELKFLSKTMK